MLIGGANRAFPRHWYRGTAKAVVMVTRGWYIRGVSLSPRNDVKIVLYRTDSLQQSDEALFFAKAFACTYGSQIYAVHVLVRGRTGEPFAGNLTVGQVTSGKVRSCRPHDTINIARATIAQEVCPLLVINSLGTLEGNFDHG